MAAVCAPAVEIAVTTAFLTMCVHVLPVWEAAWDPS